MKSALSRRSALIAACLCLAVILTVPSAGTGIAHAQEMPLIRVGTSSADTAAIVYFAQDRGFFEKFGLRVEIQPNSATTNGASAASAVLSGAFDIAVSNIVSIAVAHAKHLPLLLIAPAGVYSSKSPIAVLLVAETSSFRSGSDLNGKTIAVDGIKNNTEVAAEGWIDAHGGNSRSVHYVELPFSEMGAALRRHTIDGAIISEPALTVAKAAGGVRIMGHPFDSIAHTFIINGWFARADWIAKNPEAVRRFAGALREAAKWANDNQALTAQILVAHSHIRKNVVTMITRAIYAENLTPALIQPNIDAAAKYGVLKTGFPASELIYSIPAE